MEGASAETRTTSPQRPILSLSEQPVSVCCLSHYLVFLSGVPIQSEGMALGATLGSLF